MNSKILLALLLIIPLLTVAATAMPDVDADKGDGKSCSKDKSMKDKSYKKTKTFNKTSKSLQI